MKPIILLHLILFHILRRLIFIIFKHNYKSPLEMNNNNVTILFLFYIYACNLKEKL